jgi:glycine reductase
MIQPVRVVHYVNQFFGGIGGEEMAHVGVSLADGVVGASRALQQALGTQGTLLGTIVGGDNYVNERREEALATARRALEELRPDVLVAGPAFEAGRYGVACGELCRLAAALAIPALTAMHPENPAVGLFRRDAPIVPTGPNAASMGPAISALARLALKLGRGEPLGPAEAEGYLGRGIRSPGQRDRPAAERVAAMLRAKLRGEPFATELPILAYEAVRRSLGDD